MYQKSIGHYRISQQRCYIKKCFQKLCTNHRKTHVSESFLNKLASQVSTTLLKMRLRHRCFSINFAKFPKVPFLQSTFERLLLSSAPCKQETCWWLIKNSAYVYYVDLNHNVLSLNIILSISLLDNSINTVILFQYFNTLPFDSSRAKTTCWRSSEITVNILIYYESKNNYFQGCAPYLESRKLLPRKVRTKLGSSKNYFIDRCTLLFKEPFIQPFI